MKVAFNGKFLSANATGVHRVAEELLREAQVLMRENPGKYGLTAEIICPRDIKRNLHLNDFPEREAGLFTWQLWEQFDLPQLGRESLLVNLCNLGPIGSTCAMTMIHDAQVFLTPGSYSVPFRLWYKFVLPMIGRRHRKILTVSDYSREQLVHYNVAPREKITVIHNGVDHILRIHADETILPRLGLSPRKYACALANTQDHKNIPLLMRAFAEAELAGMSLVLIGGADRAAFSALGVEAPPNVIFAGRVSDEELRSLMENALCYLCPSKTEGFGLPPLESMLLGAPAIAAPLGALPEVCGDGALYADAQDASAWTAAIAKLTDDGAFWSIMSERGRTQAQHFTWRRAAEKLLAAIAELEKPALSEISSNAASAGEEKCAYAS